MSLDSIESIWYAVTAFDRIVEIVSCIVLIAAAGLCLRRVERAMRRSSKPSHRFVHPLGIISERNRT